ncbi:DUF5719 family protein [Streptomyces iconiensis]|uniref:DUF5719 family protein n=1 Tax=Streptomyces iconiensis TaxID=1384038 RepID=A0ABT7A8X8_9ACTN|nr:DUF5719 family protein [Streptomyces iconiensis]MDJ1137807.1 DUF5719 family protein [Streptomyces iconiensis]
MNRTILSFAGTVVALAAVTGVAAVAAPGDAPKEGDSASAASHKPVERSSLVCPQPNESDVAETTYTAFTPKGADGKKGSAELHAAELADTDGPDVPGESDKGKGGKGDKKDKKGEGKGKKEKGARAEDEKPTVPLSAPGTPVTSTMDSAGAPALVGTADGPFAPGWTVQQTTTVSVGAGRGLQGSACSAPDTSFWFPGVSTAADRQDYVHLTNPDSSSAVVDLELYGKNGKEKAGAGSGEGITVPPRSTVPVLLSTLTAKPVTNVTLHVTARSGRVGAQVQAQDTKLGGDWLAPAAEARPRAVLPGVPGDATSVRLVVFAPGDEDADLKVRLAGASNMISPAGYETLHVKGGMTTAVDLKDLTKGEPGSLVLSPAEDGPDATPVMAALRVTRGKGSDQETAFIPSTAPVERRATAADNRDGGSTLALTAPDAAAKVRVTASAGSGGGKPKSTTVTVKAHTTKSFSPPSPEGGKGAYAVTVERLSGGPVHASRMLARKQDGVPAFTIQALPDDRSTVAVPRSEQDLSVVNDGK